MKSALSNESAEREERDGQTEDRAGELTVAEEPELDHGSSPQLDGDDGS